jgi:hypothetical protein
MMDDILGGLTYETAVKLVGRTYRVNVDAGRSIELTVTRVVRAAEHGARPKELKRDSFSIFFRGPSDVMLPQRMYDLNADRDSLPHLFIVPVGREANGYEYEAVFT